MFLRHAESFGVSRKKIMDAAGLRAGDLSDPDGRVPLSVIRDAWRALIARIPDPALGLKLGRDTKIRELGLVGYAMAHSSTLEDAFRRLSRYLQIINEGLQCQIDGARSETRVIIVGHPW